MAIAAGATGALGVSYLVAAQDPVPGWEISLTQWINDAPDWVATLLYPIMQLGTIWAPVGAGLAMWLLARDRLLAVVTVGTGFVTWFAAKGVKQAVERGRPLQYIPGLNVREGAGTGLGYISGHSAVAAATAVLAMGVVPRWVRPVLAGLAGLVGIGRIVHGVHLPADVVGGWAFGTLIGLGALEAVEWARRPATVTA